MGKEVNFGTVAVENRGTDRRAYATQEPTEQKGVFGAVAAILVVSIAVIRSVLFGSPAHGEEPSVEDAGQARSAPPDESVQAAGDQDVFDQDAEEGHRGRRVEDENDGNGRSRTTRASAETGKGDDQVGDDISGVRGGRGLPPGLRSSDNDNPMNAPIVGLPGFSLSSSTQVIGQAAGGGGSSSGVGGGGSGGGSGGSSSGGGGDEDDPRRENRAPRASGFGTLETLLNTAMVITLADLLAHVSDPDGDGLSVANLRVSSGELQQLTPTQWLYVPGHDEDASARLEYTVTDGTKSVLQTATVNIQHRPDEPILAIGDNGPTYGTPSNNVIVGTRAADLILADSGNDTIDGKDGDDVILGGDGDDIIVAGGGCDVVDAGAGNDIVFAGSGADIVRGGAGNDQIHGEEGADRLFGDEGDDYIVGGGDDDVVDGGVGNDTLVASANDGNDVYVGGEGVDTYNASASSARVVIDLAHGYAAGSDIGCDQLSGIENATGGAGNDIIVANDEINVLRGGAGNDVFQFTLSSVLNSAKVIGGEYPGDSSGPGSRWDRIEDFEVGDRIDLRKFKIGDGEEHDEDNSGSGSSPFHFDSDRLTFTKSGQLRYEKRQVDDGDESNSRTFIYGNVDEDLDDDFVIELVGHHAMSKDDFFGVN